jgi:hypothetical protein
MAGVAEATPEPSSEIIPILDETSVIAARTLKPVDFFKFLR